MKGKYYKAHLHMHSCFEGTASMEGHFYQAKQVGVDLIWFTDHDNRIGLKKKPVTGFDFEAESLLTVSSQAEVAERVRQVEQTMHTKGIFPDQARWRQSQVLLEDHLRVFQGWQVTSSESAQLSKVSLSREKAFSGNQSMKIMMTAADQGNWQSTAAEFTVSGKRHQLSLLSMVTLKIACLIEKPLGNDARVIFEIKLSQHPPEHLPAKLIYVIGENTGLAGRDTGVVSLEYQPGNWKEFSLNLSQDIMPALGGQDNVFDTISIRVETRNGAEIVCYFDDFKIDSQIHGEAVRAKQRELAAKLGEKYGVIPIVATEISSAGHHKICFNSAVPLINYAERNYQVTHQEAVDWVLKHGGIFSYNHPFDFWKRIFLSDTERAEIIKKLIADFSDQWGQASLIEVGFPEGKHHFTFNDYLSLWDGLSKKGVFITGYGDSDNHANHSNWWAGNNFAAWIYAEQPSEDKLIESMRKGNLFTGDPAVFRGDLRFYTAEGYPMGAVVEVTKANYRLLLELFNAQPGWSLKWVIDGIRQNAITIPQKDFKTELTIEAAGPIHFVRAELYNQTGRCIVLTNPLYFVKDPGIIIPADRKVGQP